MVADRPRRGTSPVLEVLVAGYPVFRDGRPLAIGIHKAIRERMPDVAPEPLRQALRMHTGSTKYLKVLSHGQERFDLDGNPAGEVTAEQRQQALDTLKDRFRKATERKKAEQQEQQRQEKLAQLVQKFGR